jgi:hypothetical protein
MQWVRDDHWLLRANLMSGTVLRRRLAALSIVVSMANACVDHAKVLPADARLLIGILGDSDSHSYHDSVSFRSAGLRGGAYRESTFQWTEIWARLRPTEVDLGAWGTFGNSARVAHLWQLVGFTKASPRKQDFWFNMSFSGALCTHLTQTPLRQTQALLQRMRKAPDRWANGVVVIRIGINSFGKKAEMQQFAVAGTTSNAFHRVTSCVREIERAVRLIRREHSSTRLVLVGILDNSDWTEYHQYWRNPSQLVNIAAVLDVFDSGLREIAARDGRAIFLDDRAWFRAHWGARSPNDGRPAYRAVSFGGTDSVSNTSGDEPTNLVLSDGHAGTVMNALWLNHLVTALNASWHLGLTPLSDSEIAKLADPAGRFGIRDN